MVALQGTPSLAESKFGDHALGATVDQVVGGTRARLIRLQGQQAEYSAGYKAQIGEYVVRGEDIYKFQDGRLVGGERSLGFRIGGRDDDRFYWDLYTHLRSWHEEAYPDNWDSSEPGYHPRRPGLPSELREGELDWVINGDASDGVEAELRLYRPNGQEKPVVRIRVSLIDEQRTLGSASTSVLADRPQCGSTRRSRRSEELGNSPPTMRHKLQYEGSLRDYEGINFLPLALRVTDSRPPKRGGAEPERLGTLRGTYGNPWALHTSRQSVTGFVGSWLEDIAESERFEVRNRSSLPLLLICVEEFWIDGYDTYTLEVDLSIELYADGNSDRLLELNYLKLRGRGRSMGSAEKALLQGGTRLLASYLGSLDFQATVASALDSEGPPND